MNKPKSYNDIKKKLETKKKDDFNKKKEMYQSQTDKNYKDGDRN